MTVEQQTEVDRLRKKYLKAQDELAKAVAESCVGPHEVRQHRDARPPWCPKCRRTNLGLNVDEITRKPRPLR